MTLLYSWPMRTPVSLDGPAPVDLSVLGDDAVGRLARYWYGLAAQSGGVPPRRLFDPTDIPDLLPRLIVVERLGGEEFRYRLLGTEVDRFTKRSYTGMRTSEIEGHGPGNRIHTLYVATLDAAAPVAMSLPYVGRSSICTSVRQVAVPFRTGEVPDQVISLIEFVLKTDMKTSLIPAVERRLL